ERARSAWLAPARDARRASAAQAGAGAAARTAARRHSLPSAGIAALRGPQLDGFLDRDPVAVPRLPRRRARPAPLRRREAPRRLDEGLAAPRACGPASGRHRLAHRQGAVLGATGAVASRAVA